MCEVFKMPKRTGKSNSRKTGAYYTPAQIAEYITHQSIESWLDRQRQIFTESHMRNHRNNQKKDVLAKLNSVRILDPAVGDGVFLLAAADYLLELRCGLGDEIDTSELRASIAATNLFGVDLRIDAVRECRSSLIEWIRQGSDSMPSNRLDNLVAQQIRQGNSLVGSIGQPNRTEKMSQNQLIQQNSAVCPANRDKCIPFLWKEEFPEAFGQREPGFDIIVGNPPFGNLLTSYEKEYIRSTYDAELFGGRQGTWNSAAQFLAMSGSLLKPQGELGFILPNSIMRTKQFSNTRKFLADELGIWKVVDEGKPFEDVTLEMVSVFCSPSTPNRREIDVVSRRPEVTSDNAIPRSIFQDGEIAVLYHDALFDNIIREGNTGHISATRGRDIPRKYVHESESEAYSIRYASSGRSIRRYGFDTRYIVYASEAYLENQKLTHLQNSEFLIATKNKAYPRCVLKPKGMVHGGGVVRIRIHNRKITPEVLGLILNSRMIRYLCVRYLTNYSKLTTCLNTGIMEQLPVIYPNKERPYRILFESLQKLHAKNSPSQKARSAAERLERVADGLVYSLYLRIPSPLADFVDAKLKHMNNEVNGLKVANSLASEEINEGLKTLLKHPKVLSIEKSPRMQRRA